MTVFVLEPELVVDWAWREELVSLALWAALDDEPWLLVAEADILASEIREG